MLPLIGGVEAKKRDKAVSEALKLHPMVMMESAGRAVAEFVSGLEPDDVVILAGGGGNGGDGYVAARYLLSMGVPVRVYGFEPKGDVPAWAREAARRSGVVIKSPQEFFELEETDVLVDALFGFGLRGPLEGIYRDMVAYARRVPARIRVAVDVPSGINATTGAVMGEAFVADYTVTFGVPKIGLFVEPGFEYAGSVRVDSIGIPLDWWLASVSVRWWAVVLSDAKIPLMSLPRPAHKGEAGILAIVGGSSLYQGAPLLAAAGATSVRTGLIYLLVPDEIKPMVAGRYPELIVWGWGEVEGCMWDRVSAVVVGPGMTDVPPFWDTIAGLPVPKLLDAGALRPELLSSASSPTVITPHPGEAARLLGTTPTIVKGDVTRAVSELESLADVVVLKSKRTITARDGIRWVNTTGNHLLAVGGSGDVLAGIIGGLMARGLPPHVAAYTGVYMHGRVADERLKGEEPLLPSNYRQMDLISWTLRL